MPYRARARVRARARARAIELGLGQAIIVRYNVGFAEVS